VKENMLDILLYLLENFTENEEMQADDDQELLEVELMEVGFSSSEVGKAIDWLDGLAAQQRWRPITNQQRASMRIYSSDEEEKLDLECRGFLLFLEQVGVLDVTTRELVIDRAMALDTDDFDIEQLKWVILMVLFNNPGREEAFAWIESLVADQIRGSIH
jgi:Smg protein